MHIPHMSEWILIHNSLVPITLECTTDKACQKDLIAPLLNGKCALSSAQPVQDWKVSKYELHIHIAKTTVAKFAM